MKIQTLVFLLRIKDGIESYVDFKNLKGVAQKLGLPRPFEFLTQNGRQLLNFEVTKKF